MAAEAKENTGLFISVADVDHPVWQIRIRDQKLLDRWSEILLQSFGGRTTGRDISRPSTMM
jgi:hypothetical protein